jgi:choline kinase
MIGVILAAGMAKRLRPLTDTKPKCLLTVGSRTLLQRTVDAMAATGIREFVIVTGYRHEMIQDFLNQNFPNFTFHFLHNADYAHNNNIYSLWMSGQVVRGKEFLLMDSDILCDPQAVAAVASQSESALALNRHELNEEDMKIVVDSENRITEISKTCRIEDAVGESVGIEKIKAD